MNEDLESNLTVKKKNRKGLTHHPTGKTNNENQEEKSETKKYTTGQGGRKDGGVARGR